jgi:NAD(P)-dependent dehydrogenase (short-subunit alcohol dehydrogenase family)
VTQVVLITGAASGLGWALARACIARGDRVLLADRDADLLRQRERECNDFSGVHASVCDVTDHHQLVMLISDCERHFGALDVLINNAGITHRSPAAQTEPAVLRKVMAVDWQAPMELALLALPLLRRRRGLIVNIGSMAGWMPVPGRAGYCAAKAALAQFFEVMRLELEAEGVGVVNVYPSFLDTAIEQNALGRDGGPAGHARSTVGHIRSAQWMADKILLACERRDPWVFPDRLSAFASVLWRVWPTLYLRLIRRRFAVELQH